MVKVAVLRDTSDWVPNRRISMAMGRRQHRERQEDLWVAHTELATAPGHPFYERLNAVLDTEGFDRFVEGIARSSTHRSSVVRR